MTDYNDDPQAARTVHESEKPSLLDQFGRQITVRHPIGFRFTSAGPVGWRGKMTTNKDHLVGTSFLRETAPKQGPKAE